MSRTLKRFFFVCLSLSAGLLGGCSDSQTIVTDAGLAGAYDLTFVGNYIFITSSDRNELRVLDLGASPRDFVRAPNPLEPLSIPVLQRPLNLTRDVSYGTTDADLGKETAGPYVYARSAGSQELSVVAAAPEYFKEVKRLGVGGFITAFTARGPRGGGNSILYYATQSPEGATIYRMELPGPEALLAMGSEAPPSEIRLSLPGQTVTALLSLPATREAPEQEHLAVATRRVASESQGNPAFRTFRWDAVSGQVLQEYAFGAPVRLLATHPRVEKTAFETQICALDATTPAKSTLEAGAYVFGVLDESSCGQQTCSGVLAVDAITGELAIDSTQLPMQPISVGTALPTGLTLAPAAALQIRCIEQGSTGLVQVSEFQARPLVGIVPASNGQITFFDAVKMRPFDLDSTGVRIGSRTYLDAAGQTRTITRGSLDQIIDVQMVDGATQDDTYRLVYQGLLPNLVGRSLSDAALVQCSSTECAFQVGASALSQRDVEAQDTVVLANDAGACATDLTVTRTEALADGRGIAFTPSLPPDCANPVSFSFRAGGNRPFAVYSDGQGYVGRMGDGATGQFTVAGGYFFRPPGFDPNRPPFKALLTLYINRESLAPLPQRGDQFTVSTVSGYIPFVFSVDTSSGTGLGAYRLPGPVVYTEVAGTSYAYIAYPSADGVLQFNTASILSNTANSTGLVPYE
ncbi:conserved uncharacterized protein [Stigmatella aurantiaca DW4/3-1]|uniref:Conserved uncharacterized protein n=1 Tax=Stigmatella aurantiaca (strain DW4/3-1) TaxID=378806 RepID=E3FGQ2_STIAD|nr:conserved uncharacterized protein [Stigmatella aurantiaca DW4/3-1]